MFSNNDLFDSQKFDIETSQIDNLINTTTNMDYERQRRSRSFGLSIDYRFGDYKENKFKKDRQLLKWWWTDDGLLMFSFLLKRIKNYLNIFF